MADHQEHFLLLLSLVNEGERKTGESVEARCRMDEICSTVVVHSLNLLSFFLVTHMESKMEEEERLEEMFLTCFPIQHWLLNLEESEWESEREWMREKLKERVRLFLSLDFLFSLLSHFFEFVPFFTQRVSITILLSQTFFSFLLSSFCRIPFDGEKEESEGE